MAWQDILESRRDEIHGEEEFAGWIDHMTKYVPPCPARDALEVMLREFHMTHAGITIGPPLNGGPGLEYEMSVVGPVMAVACACDFRPGGFVANAGYIPFATDLDCGDTHFLGPHPETAELTVVQIFRKKVKQELTHLAPNQCFVHAQTLEDFFRDCTFMPPATPGHPPRK